jgi:hypothetical protein
MKRLLIAACFSLTGFWANAQATSCTYSGMLIASGTAGPVGDDNTLATTIPFTFDFYGTGYTDVNISTNGFIWLSSVGDAGCCDGFTIPTDPNITEPYIALTQTDWLPTIPANGIIYYDVVGTTPNRVFVVHYDDVKHISSTDRMSGEIQLYETTNEIRLVMSSLTGFPGSHTGTMGLSLNDGTTGFAIGTRNNSGSYSATNECWSLSTSSTVLPVKLISFDAKKSSGAAVLTWSTASEEGNKYFAIERSSNGKDFQSIAKINTKGNNSFGNQYGFTDVNPLSGKNFYRLVQYDIDNKSSHYGTKLLNFELQSEVRIEPNPFDEQLNISIMGNHTSAVQISVYDVQGRKMVDMNKNLKEGNNLIEVASKEWPIGFYSIKINQDGIITNHKAVKKVN